MSRTLGLVAGFVADRLLGDPRDFHPVAGFGRCAAVLERRWYADRRLAGIGFTTALVGAAVAVGGAGERLTRPHPRTHTVLTAACVWAVLGGRSLGREAAVVSDRLNAGDLAGARSRVTHLVGRDARWLSPDEVARATVESVAENTADAVVAPLLLGGLLGMPGLLGYRAANTLDAMVGHRSPRYRRFGWASARLDDALNLGPSRITAGLAAGLAPVVGGRPADAIGAWRRDASAHPSPNAGPVEAAFAGALRVRLGGSNVYDGRVEHRGGLGSGPAPGVDDITLSIRLATAVDWAALWLAAGLTLVPGAARFRSSSARRSRTRVR